MDLILGLLYIMRRPGTPVYWVSDAIILPQ